MSQRTNSALTATQEIAEGRRFAFGRNWARYHKVIDGERIDDAIKSLQDMLELESLGGLTFLDIGSGSGIFSLAACLLGAKVHSFDFDAASVECTRALKRKYACDNPDWSIEQGSVLDHRYMARLGHFDVVYSWGVLHHTGDMNKAMRAAQDRVAPGGLLFVALYNDQGLSSRYWTAVKRVYCKTKLARPFIVLMHTIYPLLPTYVMRKLKRSKEPRGMSILHDFLDWLGGYPFEVSKPGHIIQCHRDRGFLLRRLTSVGGKMGCNEFVFRFDSPGDAK